MTVKVERVSDHIWALESWLLVPVRVWVVTGEEGITLVDAGMPFMARGILRFLDELQAGPLQRILLTHGHSDHVGAIKAIRQSRPVPVFAHSVEIPYAEGQLAYPRRKRPETNLPRGLAEPLPQDQEGNLLGVAGLTPYWTPGHSPGHVAYYHEEDGVLLAGDLFTAKRGQLRPPMAIFTGDMAEAVRSSAIVSTLKPRRLEVSHGGAVLDPTDQLESYLRANSAVK